MIFKQVCPVCFEMIPKAAVAHTCNNGWVTTVIEAFKLEGTPIQTMYCFPQCGACYMCEEFTEADDFLHLLIQRMFSENNHSQD